VTVNRARGRWIESDVFRDRGDAGRRLVSALRSYESRRTIVLGLPRGGVPVAYEIARGLHAPLDVWVARKIGVPWYPELGLGAVAEGGYVHLNQEILERLALSTRQLDELVLGKEREVAERVRLFRGDRPPPDLRDRIVIVVDDGIATGGTVLAVVRSIRAQAPKMIVLATPVAAPGVVQALASEVERVVCLRTPVEFRAVGLWHADFGQVSDEEVARFLDRARRQREQSAARSRHVHSPEA
jgi:putative phosphoribosyl transferase